MKQYSLGPNGGILTSLNLFATRFDQASCGGAACCCAGHCLAGWVAVQLLCCHPAPLHAPARLPACMCRHQPAV